MKKKIKICICFLLVVVIGSFVACGPEFRLDLVGNIVGTSPRIDQRLADSEKYNATHPFVTLQAPEENYHVYVCTDTHITTEVGRWQSFVDAYRQDMLCPVAIHLGDIVDAQNHFDEVYTAFAQVPYNPSKPDTMMVVAGNHDICFSQWPAFLETFKTSTYYFIVATPQGQQDLYIMFDSADGTVGRKQLAWLKETLEWAAIQKFRHVVACTHTHFFMRDGSQGIATNFSIEETYSLLNLFQSYGVDMVWTGHDHSREVTEYKDMTCIIVDSMTAEDKSPHYMLVTMGDKITYDFIPLNAE
jgi:3',5'-cyclic AMP phosphodiesterase CpdA